MPVRSTSSHRVGGNSFKEYMKRKQHTIYVASGFLPLVGPARMLSQASAVPAEDPQLAAAIRRLGDELKERAYEIADNLEHFRTMGWKGRGSSDGAWFLFELEGIDETQVRERIQSEGLNPDRFMIGRIGQLEFYRPTWSAKSYPGNEPHKAERIVEAAREKLMQEK